MKPNPQQIQKVFEWFAQLLLNATRETVEPAMRAAVEDVCGEYVEIIPSDTRNLMGFYVSLRKLLVEVKSQCVFTVNEVLTFLRSSAGSTTSPSLIFCGRHMTGS